MGEFLTEEKKAQLQQEVMEEQQKEHGKKSFHQILKFFHSSIFYKRMKTLKESCLLQEKTDLFRHFDVTDEMCGICGYSFVKSSITSRRAALELDNEMYLDEEQDEEWDEAMRRKMKMEHLDSAKHQSMMRDFLRFKEICCCQVIQPLLETRAFLSQHEVSLYFDICKDQSGLNIFTFEYIYLLFDLYSKVTILRKSKKFKVVVFILFKSTKCSLYFIYNQNNFTIPVVTMLCLFSGEKVVEHYIQRVV